MKPNYFVVNGIMTDADSVIGWTDVFEDFYQNEGFPCDRYEYTCGFFKSLFQKKRVADIATVASRITRPIIYVGHSNGCELFGQILKTHDVKFDVAHLFAPAMDSDCNLNGLTYGLLSKRVRKIYLYCSKKDSALRDYASKTTWMKIFGMGYGTLGFSGPQNIMKLVEDDIQTVWNNKMDHSDWFNKKNIQESFQLTLRR